VSLVLDEFALILHLQDVYWTGAGQLSVEAVSITAACLGLALIGFSPFGVQHANSVERLFRFSASGLLAFDGLLAIVCALKGKYRCALFGLFVGPIALVGALRLARPTSIWARRYYGERRMAVAVRRATAFDLRWQPVQLDWEGFIGGRPSAGGSGSGTQPANDDRTDQLSGTRINHPS
jgi:hypothetical protein